MITFIFNSNSKNSYTYSFTKTLITLGTGLKSHTDFPIAGNPSDDIFVKIVNRDGCYIALNIPNDPFITINEMPFGRKKLANGDILKIGKQEIVLEIKEEISLKEIEELFEQVNNFEEKEEIIPLHEPLEIENPPVETVQDNVEPIPDTTETVETPSEVVQKNDFVVETQKIEMKSRNWKSLIVSCLFLFTCLIFGLTLFSIHVYNKNTNERKMAAEGIADVAIALAYAQVNHLTPQKQNWSDPDFIKNNLSAVLSAEYPSFVNIDNKGHFKNCPYILRIYTSNDLAQFLVIAQPEPNFLQSLLNNETLVVDSTHMEIRSISDLRTLNRILVDANTLDGSHSADIATLMNEAKVIPLIELGQKKGFAPPKALALVRPEAENLIYNAPRYYYFGESLLKKAITLLNASTNNPEVARLQQQFTDLSKFHHFILYSSHGLKNAMESQRALAKFAPHVKFLMAYLNLDAAGNVTGSHLLLDAENDVKSPSVLTTEALSSWNNIEEPIALENEVIIGATESEMHPVLKQLKQISNERKEALKPIRDRMIALLEKHTESGFSEFSGTFYDLLMEYEQVDKEEEEKIFNKITELNHEYSDVTEEAFTGYLKQANLDNIADND